jgi:hypothetical protein
VLTQGLVNEAALQQALGVELQWHELHRENKKDAGTTVTVAPQASGLVRLGWQAKTTGDERLSADLWAQAQKGSASPRSYQKLEVPVMIVPAFLVDPPVLQVDDLSPREKKEVEFWCFSGTRAWFALQAEVLNREKAPDPCFSSTWRPLTWEEREQLAERLKTRVLFGYRIHVDINERLNETVQLDLGPFRRRITLTSDPGLEPQGPAIMGTVRGEVSVGSPEDKERIDLKSFRADLGKRVHVSITTDPGVDLQTQNIEFEPEFLKVDLKKVKEPKGSIGAIWDLAVEVPPNRAAGPMPLGSAVFLKTVSKTPRRIRIPINGNAYSN